MTIKKLVWIVIVSLFFGTACSSKIDSVEKEIEVIPPLFQAVYDKDIEEIKRILENNKQSINDNYKGRTALHASIYEAEIDIIKLLVENGADFTIKDEYGSSPFFLAVDLSFIKAIHYFLDKGANPNEVNNYNETPMMMFALRAGIPTDVFMEITERMVNEGADLSVEDINGNTFYSYLEQVQFDDTIKQVYRLIPPSTN